MKSTSPEAIGTIAVDLTPVLSGGENGGAKVFVLELLRRLAELFPATQFVLLTQAGSHEELAALDRANVRRILISPGSGAPAARASWGVLSSSFLPYFPRRLQSITRRTASKFVALTRRMKTRGVLDGLNIDLLFCPFTAPTYAEETTPTVSVIYDLQFKAHPEFFTDDDVAHRDQSFLSACNKSSLLTAISDFSRDEAIQYGRLDPDKIQTVHLQISNDRLHHAKKDPTILPRLQLDPGRYLIFPANFWKHKNHEMLLTAFAMARAGGLAEDIKLVCTGAGGARQQWLMRAAAQIGLERHVVFPGFLSSAEFLTLLSGSAGLIFPSLYEGFGLPVIEAMAIGVPVACSNITSLPEVAEGAAILFDPRMPTEIAKAMVSLVHDEPLRQQLIKLGHARASEFSDSTVMARQYWEIFLQATALKRSSFSGAYVDGWVGPRLKFRLEPAAHARQLQLELHLPSWAPSEKVKIKSFAPSGMLREDVLKRDNTMLIEIPVAPAGGRYEVRFVEFFVPRDSGLGEDQRELAAQLLRCAMSGPDGEAVDFSVSKF